MIDRLNAALEGRYTIERELGEGGMALVYLATDLKHDRRVALKVLKEDLAAVVGEERFLDEIRTTAKLQHPNILPLFDSGAASGFLFYAMPYVQGETLREKLKREVQLPVEDAIELVQKIAGALDYAHEQGIVHRDIKPSNVLLSSGEPLIADFGIAIAVSQANDGRRTETGLSLGTPHYMSPEQAAGDRSLDPRSDIYALGCVLQELLTGEPPFSGANAQAVLARILTTRPTPVTSLRPTVPPHVDSVISKALEKLPADRFKTAKDFRKALGDVDFRHTVVERTMGSTAVPTQTRIVREGVKTPVAAGIGIAALLVGVIGGTAVLGGGGSGRSATLAGPPVRTTLDIGDGEIGSFNEVVISPDGSSFAYIGEGGLYWRPAEDLAFRLIPGTERAEEAASVTFSPDGEWIAWADNQALMKVSLLGGLPTPVVPAGDLNPRLIGWNVPGTIVFWASGSEGLGLYRVADNGGTPTRIIGAPDWPSTFFPQLLPDESGVLFTDTRGDQIALYSFDADSVTVLIPGGVDATYVPETGHIVYADGGGGLWAVPFDLRRHELAGEARPVLQGLRVDFGSARYSVSANGTLVVGTGPASGSGSGSPGSEMGTVDLNGAEVRFDLPSRVMFGLRWDPEGRRVAFSGTDPDEPEGRSQIWTYDTQLENAPRQLTEVGTNSGPVWSPDGTRVAFVSRRDGVEGSGVYLTDPLADNSPDLIWSHPDIGGLSDWPADSTFVVFVGRDAATSRILRLTLGGDTTQYYAPPSSLDDARVSPDGRWMAYSSDESGTWEAYVRAYPDPGIETKISAGDGDYVRWAPDGRTIYYLAGDSLFAADLQLEPTLEVIRRRPVIGRPSSSYDIHPDGERFVASFRVGTVAEDAADEATDAVPEQHIVIHNWFTDLRRIMGEGN